MRITLQPDVKKILPWLQRGQSERDDKALAHLHTEVEQTLPRVFEIVEPQGDYREVAISYDPLTLHGWVINSTKLVQFFKKNPAMPHIYFGF